MTGSAFKCWELRFHKYSKYLLRMGRGLGRGCGSVEENWGPADDGKRLGLSEAALDVVSRKLLPIGEGVRGRGGFGIGPGRGPADL